MSTGSAKKIEGFLKALRPHGGAVHVCSVPPNGGTPVGVVFDMPEQADAAAAWVLEKNETGHNTYYTFNEVAPGHRPLSKPSKDDITAICGAHCEVDPKGEGSYANRRNRLLNGQKNEIEAAEPTYLVDSGNGLQALWLSEEPLSITQTALVEGANLGLIQRFGGDPGTQNIDRLLRVPFTKNYASQKKLGYGYPKTTKAKLLTGPEHYADVHRLVEQYPALTPHGSKNAKSTRLTELDYDPVAIPTEGQDTVRERFMKALANNAKLRARMYGELNGLIDKSRSGIDKSIGTWMRKLGFTYAEFCFLMMDQPPANSAFTEQDNRYFYRCFHQDEVSNRSANYDPKAARLTFSNGEPSPPEYIIDDLLPVAAGGIVGTGGSKKSTFTLWMMLHIVAGLPLFGREINRPGPCLFITAEDERSLIEYRVWNMQQEIVSDMPMEQRAQVMKKWSEGLYIEDVSGELDARLVRAEGGHMIESDDVREIIEAYRPLRLSCLAIDPTVYFGPGEQYINDGMAALMAVGKKLSKQSNCPVVFVHHVSQDVSRNEIIDAHSGRSGTAFGDNARFMYVIVNHKENPKYMVPPEMATCEQPVRIHQVKNSFGMMLKHPLWFDRMPGRPWKMIGVEGFEMSPEEKQAKRKAEDKEAVVKAILPAIAQHFPDGGTKNQIEKIAGKEGLVWHQGTRISRDRFRTLIQLALEMEYVYLDKSERYPLVRLTGRGKEAIQ